jgi:SpoVK/Ycf46/Vps4 family AAA+-type ATPase
MCPHVTGYSFSDLAAVMREAALAPVRELMTQFSDQDLYSSVCEALQPADTPLTAAGSSDEDAGRGVLPHMRPLQLSDFLAAFAKVAPAGQDADGG